MFEKRIKEISEKLRGEKKDFYVLIHKKHRREIYFQNNKNAIKFMNTKFNQNLKKFGAIKKLAYFLIKIGFLQIFLKKIRLSEKLGDVIFVGGQIKGFDLDKKKAISFPLEKNHNKYFLKSKEFQKKAAKKSFAPEIFEINRKFPYCTEELLKKYNGEDDIGVFKRLFLYYKRTGIKEVTLEKYLKKIKRNLINKEIKRVLKKINLKYSPDTRLKIVTSHGSFTSEQVLIKKGCYVFVDWEPHKNLISWDLFQFFREESNLLKNKKFKELLKFYSKDVKENIELYLRLNEIYSVTKKEKVLKSIKSESIIS